ncbi:MAG: 1,4-dihydroxy-2-naphthoate octaprenyltransferase, partial [Actinomycetales bacterium]
HHGRGRLDQGRLRRRCGAVRRRRDLPEPPDHAAVKRAALGFLGLGAALGVALAATTTWWLLLVGAAALVAAWTYTGGPSPYGYRALGEVSVFLFFGLVAVLGTTYVQLEEVTGTAVAAAVGIGALACAILVANNLRDIPTDTVSGKRTLAVVLGDARSRRFYALLCLVALVAAVVAAVTAESYWLLLAFVCAPLVARSVRTVLAGSTGPALIPVLKKTGVAELLYAVGLTVGCIIGS